MENTWGYAGPQGPKSETLAYMKAINLDLVVDELLSKISQQQPHLPCTYLAQVCVCACACWHAFATPIAG